MVTKDAGDEYFRFSYIKMNVVLWNAVHETMQKITHLNGEITKLKGKGKGVEKGEGK